MLGICFRADVPSKALQVAAGYAGRTRSSDQQLGSLLAERFLEMTVPNKPTSPAQRYRLAEKGCAALNRVDVGFERNGG